MNEKMKQKELSRQSDALYANQVAASIQTVEQTEKLKKQKQESLKQDYINDLNNQIKTEKQRKKYDILMTEHERRIHDKTIKAYEQNNASEIQTGGLSKLGQHYSII